MNTLHTIILSAVIAAAAWLHHADSLAVVKKIDALHAEFEDRYNLPAPMQHVIDSAVYSALTRLPK